MKFRLPGKKVLVLGASLLVLGGAGYAGFRYLDVSQYVNLAGLPYGISEHIAALIPPWSGGEGSAEPAAKDEHANKVAQDTQEAEQHAVTGESGYGEESQHTENAPEAEGDSHGAEGEAPAGKDGGGEHAAPQVPYAAPSTLQSPLIAQVRALQMVQERLAQGDKSAVTEQQKVLIATGRDVFEIDPEKASLEEIYASVTYLLSGGRPDAVERFLARKDLPQTTRKLLKGAVAYVRGDALAASDELRDLDPRQFGSAVAGHLAMVQARAIEDLPPERRRELLDFTANTMLGTLLEEAALRRLMELAAGNNDKDSFLRAANRYDRRFAPSLYNAEYRNALLQGIVKLESEKHGPSAAQLDLLLFGLKQARRNDILDSLAEAGLRNGLSNLCRYGASRLRRLSAEGSVPWTKATLYDVSCTVAESGQAVVERLKSLDVALIDPEDRKLRSLALLLAERAALADTPGQGSTVKISEAEVLTENQSAFRVKVQSELASIGKIIAESGE